MSGSQTERPAVPQAVGQVPSEPAPPLVLDTDQMFTASQHEVRIRHRGQEYRLRITKQGKLILTK